MRLHLAFELVSAFTLVIATLSSQAAGAEFCSAPSRLSCELLLEPARTVIYDPRPELGWECGSGGQSYRQSAYQVIVRKNLASSTSPADVVWDSGRVQSEDSLNIEYGGLSLEPSQEYTWQVRAWNTSGLASDWSAPQTFRLADYLSETETSRYRVIAIPQIARSVQKIEGQTYLADFGTAAFGYLKLQVEPSDQSREIEICFGEKLLGDLIDRKPGGTIRTYTVNVVIAPHISEIEVRPPKDSRNTSGQAIQLPNWIGVVAPFRYVEIHGLASPLNNGAVQQIRYEYPFDDDASMFECSDETLNSIWQLCKYSIRATTFCGIYVDGDRERIPYEADAFINQLSHYGVDREYALARHSHEYLLKRPTWPTEWKQHSVLMAWADYWYTGDSESLARNYHILRTEKIPTAAERPDGLVDTSRGYRDIVDWPEGERDGHEMLPINTVVNAFHYATLMRMAYLASVLDLKVDEHEYLEKAALLKDTFNKVLWNESEQRYIDGEGSHHSSIHANLFPLSFGLVPEERQPAVVKFVKSRNMRCSVYAAQYLLEGLYLAGEDDYALKLLTSRSRRSWYNMIRSGSTITLEAWDQAYKPNLDWNHAWGAAPANLIPMCLVGVRPSEPAFKRFVVQPRPGNLSSFAAKVPSPRGTILVHYHREASAIHMEVGVPGNSLASVGIPLREDEQITSALWNGNKIDFRREAGHAWISNVPPGNHVFRATTELSLSPISSSNSSARK